MIAFNVIKDQNGWAVRRGSAMTIPFWTRDLAIREAKCLADAIRCHGECTGVIVEDADSNEPPKRIKGVGSSRLRALSRGRWGRPATTMSRSGALKAS